MDAAVLGGGGYGGFLCGEGSGWRGSGFNLFPGGMNQFDWPFFGAAYSAFGDSPEAVAMLLDRTFVFEVDVRLDAGRSGAVCLTGFEKNTRSRSLDLMRALPAATRGTMDLLALSLAFGGVGNIGVVFVDRLYALQPL